MPPLSNEMRLRSDEALIVLRIYMNHAKVMVHKSIIYCKMVFGYFGWEFKFILIVTLSKQSGRDEYLGSPGVTCISALYEIFGHNG